MKKIFIPFFAFAVFFACLLCPLSVGAATLSYNTSDFLSPIVSKADGSIVKHPSALNYPNGDVANFYWCGTNTKGAYTFGNVWKSHKDRNAPTGYAEEMWLNFHLASTGAYVGDFVHFDTNISFMFSDYEVLEVYLIPAFDDGVSSQRRTIFSNTNGTWTGAVNWTGTFTSFSCFPDDNPTVAESRKVCDGFVLSISLRQSNYPSNSNTYPYSKGLWVQFSEESIFFSGSSVEYENMLSQKENNKLLTDMNANQAETNKQLEEANDTLDDISGKQDETNEKLDDVNDGLSELGDKQDKTNKKLDGLTDEQEKTNDILTEEKYQGADTSTSDELTSAEDKLMQDTAQGREDVESIMSVDSFMDNLNKLLPGILAATQIMDLCFNTIAPMQTLIYIALALGFVSFVLGTVNMVVGSVRSANARKEREAQRDKRRAQK